MQERFIPFDDIEIIFVIDSPGYSGKYLLGFALLSACLKKQGFKSIQVIYARERNVEVLFNQKQHTFLAFSTITATVAVDIAYARKIKKKYPYVITLFGGAHATFAPEIIYEEGVDAVCRGEAEEALPELLCEYDYQKARFPHGVRNWWIKTSDGEIEKNELRPLVKNIDLLPFLDRSIFPMETPIHQFIFSRGCPRSCVFCSQPELRRLYGSSFKDYYRVRSVESAIREMQEVIALYGKKTIVFQDSIFGLDETWLRAFCEQYQKEIGLPFRCNSEVEYVTSQRVTYLKNAGCELISLGLESANEKSRKKVLGKKFTNESFFVAVELINQKKIDLCLFVMVGIPDSALEDDFLTIRFVKQINPRFHLLQVFSFLPGTSVTKAYQSKGTIPKHYIVSSNALWPVANYKSAHPQLAKLIRLQELYTFITFFGIQRLHLRISFFSIPIWIIRVLISLPIFGICSCGIRLMFYIKRLRTASN